MYPLALDLKQDKFGLYQIYPTFYGILILFIYDMAYFISDTQQLVVMASKCESLSDLFISDDCRGEGEAEPGLNSFHGN